MKAHLNRWAFFILILVAALSIHTEMQFLKGVGPERAALLADAYGIKTVEDLLYLMPNRYEDKSQELDLSEPYLEGKQGYVVAEIGLVQSIGVGKKRRLEASASVRGKRLKLLWFKGLAYATKNLKETTVYKIYGKLNGTVSGYSMVHPEIKIFDPAKKNEEGLEPVYPSVDKALKKGLNSKAIHKIIKTNLPQLDQFPFLFSVEVERNYALPSAKEVFYNIHLPENLVVAGKLIWVLKLEELFYHQLINHQKKTLAKIQNRGLVFEHVGEYFNAFYKGHIPFELTKAQKRVIREIRGDTLQGKQMNRLLQGDVGSGKTMVAFLTALLAIDNGYQACIMAPTEILARQHYHDFSRYAEALGLRCALLTGSVKVADRRPILEGVASGTIHLLVGTHALIEPKVVFKNLGLAVVDEQHKFGVAQRAVLSQKNVPSPHVLVMTATPIPRTLTMSHYGDLDISVIDELPPGRKPVRTVHRTDAHRLSIFSFIKDEINKGRQIYMVYPLIEESEALDYKDLMDGYESVSRAFPLPEYRISMVHGKMDVDTKNYEMNRFVKGETQIMVATTVIEVGVNVPNASVMVIESAEKFGLSQLHQLRGRIGRGAEQSFCILVTKDKLGKDAKTRIETMVGTTDGFKVAEVDLRLRGPGNVLGTQQSGTSTFRIANIVEDFEYLKKATLMAQSVLSDDPHLQLDKNKVLSINVKKALKTAIQWANVG